LNWTVGGAAVVALLLAGGWLVDRWIWRARPREKLLAMLESGNWRYYKAAILELRRRGEDVSVHAPRIQALLASGSRVERAAGAAIARACFPGLK